jgi:hypothetical protein
MKKTARKLALHKESLRNLSNFGPVAGQGTAPSICNGCTSEYTWYCQTASACTHCPICEIN